MGGEAKLCMNILMYPESLPAEAVNAILRGGYDKVMEAGAIVVGGHTIKDDIPKYGLCVSGLVHPDKILKNNGVQDKDVLILTKAIGTGLIINAVKGELADAKQYKAGLESMISLNKYAADAVKGLDGIHACTDVTGFSVIGHSLEMCEGTGLGVVIDYRKVFTRVGRNVKLDCFIPLTTKFALAKANLELSFLHIEVLQFLFNLCLKLLGQIMTSCCKLPCQVNKINFQFFELCFHIFGRKVISS